MGVKFNPFTSKLDIVDSPSGEFSDIELALGTQTDPSLSFTGDPNTGIYSPGADQLAISTNGSGRLFVNNIGNVGIGTASPFGRLHIQDDANNVEIFAIGPAAGSSRIRFGDSADTNIGQIIYDNTNDSLQIHVNNSERLRVDSSGRLGLGTSNPATQLEVNQPPNFGWIQITSIEKTANDAGAAAGAEFVGSRGDNNDTFYGRLCLGFRRNDGTAIQSQKRLGGILFGGQHGTGTTYSSSDTAYAASIVGVSESIFTDASSMSTAITFRTGSTGEDPRTPNKGYGTERMRIDSSGKVGIGTATPGSALEINAAASTSPFIAKINTSEVARIGSSGRLLVGTSTAANNVEWFGTNYVSPYLQIAGLSQNATQSIISYTNSATATGALYLGKSRGATVGTNTALQNGDIINEVVYAANDGTNFIRSAIISAFVDGALSTDEVPGRLVFYTNNGASGASPTERMRIDSSGDTIFAAVTNKAGILTGAANGKYISWSNSIMYSGRAGTTLSGHINFYNGNGLVGSITTDASATAYNTLSDYRLKENVVPLTGAIDRLNQLQVHRFNFIADPDTTVDGFLAHEAQAVVPECVTGTKDEVDDEGNPVYQGIDQSKLVPLLTAALQEALAEIESLKARVTALEP
jgi:hypothetical protein